MNAYRNRAGSEGRQMLMAMLNVVLLIFVITGAFGIADSHAQTEKTVKIGLLAPFSGKLAPLGEEWQRGALLAIGEINAKGGINGYKFEMITADVKDQKPIQVLDAMDSLLKIKDVHCLLAGWASDNSFEIEHAAEAEMPYINAGNSMQVEEIVKKNPDKFGTVWNYAPTYYGYETEFPKCLEKWAAEGRWTMKKKTVAMVTSDFPYSLSVYKGMMKQFRSLGWSITAEVVYPNGAIMDWQSFLQKVRDNPPEVIVNADYIFSNAAVFMDQFMENPTDSIVFIQYGPSLPEFLELAKNNSTGIIYDYISAPLPGERYDHILKIYKAKYPELTPDPYVFSLYEMVYVYADALAKVGDPSKHAEIGEAIGKTDKNTVMGRLAFNPESHCAREGDEFVPTVFYQIWDGNRHILHPRKIADAEMKLPPWFKK